MDEPLTVLLVHNRYQEPGGEDAVFEAEGRLLESRGHRVVRYEVHNRDVADLGTLRLGARAVWSVDANRALRRLAEEVRPDVAHVHNTLPLLSPSIHHALSDAGASVVQTLHNYRLLCPQGMLLRDGRPCESCVGRTPPWPGVVHGCYRGSRAATVAVAAMLTVHRGLGTWTKRVDAFIALSEFARGRFIAGGLPTDRLHVKSNFVDPDPGPGSHDGGFLLYVGRLSPEKGVTTLLDAWRVLERDARAGRSPAERRDLIVVGDGPLAGAVSDAAATLPGIRWEGRQPRERVLDLMGRARALVFPSVCYENAPGVVLEAFARGLPVLGSRLGSTAELVRDGGTGRLFTAGDPLALARVLEQAYGPGAELEALGRGARLAYEASHTAEANARQLLRIYADAMSRKRRTPVEDFA